MAPAWDDLAKEVGSSDEFKGVTIGKVDCDANKEMCNAFQIRGYPTLLLVKEDRVYPYNGDRMSLDAHKEFIRGGYKQVVGTKSPLARAPVTDIADIPFIPEGSGEGIIYLTSRNFLNQTKGRKFLVAAMAHWCPHCKALTPVLGQLASRKGKSFDMAIIECESDKEFCVTLGVKSFPWLFLVEDGNMVRYEGSERTEQALRAFGDSRLDSHANVAKLMARGVRPSRATETLGNGVEVLNDRIFDIETADFPWLIVLFDKACDGECDKLVKEVLPGVAAKRPTLHLGAVKCADPKSRESCATFKHGNRFPHLSLVYRDRIFTYNGESSVEAIVSFIEEGFRNAPQTQRLHITSKRRLSFATATSVAAWKDFARQNRYLFPLALVVGACIWGVLMGSLFVHDHHHSPREPRLYTSADAAAAAAKKKN